MRTKKDPGAKEAHTKSVRLDCKAVTEEGAFEGYGSVFGNEDSYGDVVEPGAFADSLKAHEKAGTMPALLWQHNPAEPIGVYSEMREDDRGLYVKGQLALETQKGREAHALLKAGALNGLSIGYRVVRWEYSEDDELYRLLEIDLWEVSLVTFPANGLARIDNVKAEEIIATLTDWRSIEAYIREECGHSKKAAIAMTAAIKRVAHAERDAQEAQARADAAVDQLWDTLNKQ